ncbi:MAG: ribulose-phosphate 3-epimerase [Planctomycetes bacterium]|nr:ribulose-phosphate 3-epimerase [Planctomycetota bacterium]
MPGSPLARQPRSATAQEKGTAPVTRPLRIAPSLLACDFARLADELAEVEAAGADWHHVDVMDGHFVPNLTIGPAVVERIKAVTARPLDVHLMMKEPVRYAEAFVKAGADVLTFHVEVCPDDAAARAAARALRAAGASKVGIALNPDTPIERVAGILDEVELVLVMSVFPGFGGQRFMPEVLAKTTWLRQRGYAGHVEMDGGLNQTTLPLCAAAGADVLVVGSAIYGERDRARRISELRAAGESAARAASKA